MILKLHGHLSYIDKYAKLHCTYIEEGDAYGKLAKHITEGNHPYNEREFSVTLPKKVPEDIVAKVGLDCIIYVKLHPYNFTSRLEKNLGEQVIGTKLILIDIKVDPKYLQ